MIEINLEEAKARMAQGLRVEWAKLVEWETYRGKATRVAYGWSWKEGELSGEFPLEGHAKYFKPEDDNNPDAVPYCLF